MRERRSIATLAAGTAAALALSACGGGSDGSEATAEGQPATTASLPQGNEQVQLDPADFTTEIDNPYWPMKPGTTWVFEETDPTGSKLRDVVAVTNRTKMIANGVEARVVRDVATEDGEVVESTDDWYAQDSAGNIWYLGEDTAEYANGKVESRAGSFEAGVDGAQPGIALPADPEPGLSYRQEYDKGNAEDTGAVITVGEEQVQVPTGHYTDVLMTRDLVPLEPKVQELKFYARGVGPVLSLHTDGPGERSALVSFKPGRG